MSIVLSNKLVLFITDDRLFFLSFRCDKTDVDPSPGCTDTELDLYEGPAYCGIILDTKGPFAACHPKINPNVSEIKSHHL